MSKNSIIDHQVENPESELFFLCDNDKGEPLYFNRNFYLQEVSYKRVKEGASAFLDMFGIKNQDKCH